MKSRKSTPDIMGNLMSGNMVDLPKEEHAVITKQIEVKPAEEVRAPESDADFVRSTLIIRKRYLEKLKVLSLDNKATIKDLLDQALSRFLMSDDIKSNYDHKIKDLNK